MTGLKDTPGNTGIGLSVVIIARDEARNIARTIEAVLRAVKEWPQAEVLLVDSASTDDTVKIAQSYPINIVRLGSSWYLSAAAGRYIGTCHTQGDWILFIDGDMELDPEWLNRSIPFALEHYQTAAIGGYWRDVYMSNGQIVGEEDWRRDPQGRVLEVKFLTGAMLCRRSAIEEVGGFQPYLKSEEEIDLSIRLRHAGYKLIRLPYLICRHYCMPDRSLSGSLRRLQHNLWVGYGQIPRYYLGTPLFSMYFDLRLTSFIYLLGIFFLLASLLLTLFFGNVTFIAGWALIAAIVIMVLSIKNRSLHEALLSCLIQVMIVCSAVHGFMMRPRSQTEYPTTVEIVQVHCHRGGFGVDTLSSMSILQNQ